MLSARSQRRHHRLRLPDRHRATVAVFFSIIAVGCLDYFFMEVASIENATVLAALLVTSLVITGLMRRPRRLGGALVDVTAARRVDEGPHKAQAELAHVIRLPTLGELLAR